MDVQRSCYRSSMRLYSDRPDLLTPGRWYRCPPGAQSVGWTAFFARRNELQDTVDAPLGEVYQSRYAYSSAPPNPRLNGLHTCGGPALTEGIPYADRPGLVLDVTGMPQCCQAAPPPPARLTLCGQGSTPLVYDAAVAIDAEYDRPTATGAVALDATYVLDPQAYDGAVAIDATYSDSSPITTACCPSNPTPVNLTCSFSGLDPCPLLAGSSYPLTYDPVNAWWSSAPVTLGGLSCVVVFQCDGSIWTLNIVDSATLSTDYWHYFASISGTCSPFIWVISVLGNFETGACSSVVSTGTIVPT